jgi:hypothetical protein
VNAPRPHPFELIFDRFRAERFPAIRAAVGDNCDLDRFLLAAPALELMQELRPETGFGDAVDDFVALVHAAYRFWCDGEVTASLSGVATRALCAPGRAIPRGAPAFAADRRAAGAGTTRYVQVAPRVIWGQLADEAPFEPLDGWFALPIDGGVRMVACFGVHADRPGVSVVAAEGERPDLVEREDGTPLFAPMMTGGDVAHLRSIAGPDELLILGWRERDAEGNC